MSKTLTGLNVDAVAYLRARGFSAKEIQQKLSEGVKAPQYEKMEPVTVTVPAVAARLKTDHVKKLVYKHRLEMYGDVYESPLAYAGQRVKELSALVESAKASLQFAETSADAVKIRAEIRGHLAAIKAEADSTQTEMTIRQEAGSAPVIEAKGTQEAMRALVDELGPMVALESLSKEEEVEVQ